MKRLIRIIFEFIKLITFYPISLFLRHKNIYLFSERGVDARDNGLYLFEFFIKNHPEINAFYVIDKKSNDIDNLMMYKNKIVFYKTIRHYLYFFAAKKRISTHKMGTAPNNSFYLKLLKMKLLPGFNIMLQHGITQNMVEMLNKTNARFDLFFCGAKPEYDFVLNNFGYGQDVVKYTGFARFDGLWNATARNQILIMPTWRMYIKTEEEFFNSAFWNNWKSIVLNERLIETLSKNNLELVFYLHHEFQKYVSSIDMDAPNCVKIASERDFDVQKLLKESKLLITDYSSVFFDFGFMGKPVIYFQFDINDFYKNHYKKGYFDFEKMGFGPVIFEPNRLCEYIISSINFGFENSCIYKKRIESFFPLRDANNCMRITKEVLNLSYVRK